MLRLPADRHLVVSLAEPIRIAENAADDDELRSWFEIATADNRPLPAWPDIRHRLRWNLEPIGLQVPDGVGVAISRNLQRVLVEVEPDETRLRYITWPEARSWGASDEAISDAADQGLDRLMTAAAAYVEEPVTGHPVASFETPSPSKASLLLAASLRSSLPERLGWPVLAVAPARDFLLLFGEASADVLLPRLGGIVHREFSRSGYPLAEEVLRVSDRGIEAVGSFQPP